MAYNFTEFKTKANGSVEWLKKEMSAIRTGRATPNLLDSVQVEAYDSRVPVEQVAGVTIEDARCIRVSPWDMTQVKAIEKAIVLANLGVSVAVDDKGIRVIFPELTSERRVSLMKIAKQKLEEARISLRTEREGVWDDIQKQTKEGIIREDDKFRLKDELQKIVDETNTKFDELAMKKEKEISN